MRRSERREATSRVAVKTATGKNQVAMLSGQNCEAVQVLTIVTTAQRSQNERAANCSVTTTTSANKNGGPTSNGRAVTKARQLATNVRSLRFTLVMSTK